MLIQILLVSAIVIQTVATIYALRLVRATKYNSIWILFASQAEFTPKTIQTRDERANLVYAVKIAVRNDGFLKLGMYGEVKWTGL